jgi:integrase
MNFKLAQIYNANKSLKKPWYVYFSYIDPTTGKYKRFIEKRGINRLKSYKERMEEATNLRDAINLDLKEGWNPFANVQTAFLELNQKTFIQALDYALEKKKLYRIERTYIEYKSQLKYIKVAIEQCGLTEYPITNIKRAQIKQVLYKIMQSKSVNTYNKYLLTLKSLYTVLVEDEIIEASPVHGIKMEKKAETAGYKSFDLETKKTIKDLLYQDSFVFGLIGEIIYETGIRPNEILNLKWQDIDHSNLALVVTGESAKNSKIRIVPIKERISKMLKKLYLNNSSPNADWFLFGDQATLASGPSRFNRNRLSERWRKVLDAGKLPTDLKLYGLKHTGADDKIMAGVDLEYLKDLYGHHSTKMTRIYAKKIKEKGAEFIRKNAPDF